MASLISTWSHQCILCLFRDRISNKGKRLSMSREPLEYEHTYLLPILFESMWEVCVSFRVGHALVRFNFQNRIPVS